MKLKLNVLIFDFDGVLIDSGLDIANSVRYAQQTLGVPLSPVEEVKKHTGKGVVNLMKGNFPGCSDEIIMQAVDIYKKYYSETAVLQTRMYPDVKETLEYFRNKKMALVTNKPQDLSIKILEALGIARYFSMVIGPESVKNMKPHPEGILKVLEAFGESPSSAVMIGDSNTDIEAGRNAGTHTCGVAYGLSDLEELKGSCPDFMIDGMLDLMRIIE